MKKLMPCPKKPKPKKEKLSALKKKADSAFSVYIRKRDGGRCVTCGVVKPWKEMQAGHYVTRACLALRYDEMNVHCQCFACNCMKHGDLITYREKMVEMYSEPSVQVIESLRHKTGSKMTACEYHLLIDIYTLKASKYD